MPRKNAMRDSVSAVRSRLPRLANVAREQIELALHYYDFNIDETVEAFERNDAVEALSGWTEMSNGRGNNSNKRTNNNNNKSGMKSACQKSTSNTVLRPSQRVSNIFQTFADNGGQVQTHSNLSPTSQATSISDNQILESYPSTDLSFHPCLSQDSAMNNSDTNEYNNMSNVTTTSSIPTDENNHIEDEKLLDDEKLICRRRNSSTTLNHEQNHHEKFKSTMPSENKKLLSKSAKDLQRQTSTLTNVELSFENEIKYSLETIDDIFKQLHDILKQRQIELYLEIDQVKQQGLNIIHRRQQHAFELRQRMNACDQLQLSEIDHLRTDIKQFVTGDRYELGEELISTHRFEYDKKLIEFLKTFGTVLRIDGKDKRSRTLSTSSAAYEQKIVSQPISTPPTTTTTIDKQAIEPISTVEHALPQRLPNKFSVNGNHAGEYHSKSSQNSSQTNGFHHYNNDSYKYQTTNRRRSSQQHQYQDRNSQRIRTPQSSSTTNPNHRRNGFNNNSETTNTYRRTRPSPQSLVPLSSNS